MWVATATELNSNFPYERACGSVGCALCTADEAEGIIVPTRFGGSARRGGPGTGVAVLGCADETLQGPLTQATTGQLLADLGEGTAVAYRGGSLREFDGWLDHADLCVDLRGVGERSGHPVVDSRGDPVQRFLGSVMVGEDPRAEQVGGMVAGFGTVVELSQCCIRPVNLGEQVGRLGSGIHAVLVGQTHEPFHGGVDALDLIALVIVGEHVGAG